MFQTVMFDLAPRPGAVRRHVEVRQSGDKGQWFSFRERDEMRYLGEEVHLHIATIMNALPLLQQAAEVYSRARGPELSELSGRN